MKMAGPRWTSQAAFLTNILVVLTTGAFTAHVPLLIWSTESLPPLASSAAGHITSNEQLSVYLSSALSSKTHTVLLFLQNKLSQDDFTVYSGVYGNKEDSAFKNLEGAMKSPYTATVPALEWSGSSAVPGLLEEKLGVSPVLVDPDALSDLKMDASVNNLLLVNLPYCGPDKPCREVLRSNDEIIGHVLTTMESRNIPYTAMFTGLQPSRVIAEQTLSKDAVGRSLLQAPVAPDVRPPIMYNVSNSPCIMLWAQNLNVSFAPNTDWIDLALLTPTLTGSVCNATNSELRLSYTGGIILSFSMSQRFYPVSARNWFTLDSVQLQSNGASASFTSRTIYAPAEYSYHCQSVTNFRDALLVPTSTNASVSNWRLNFVDFQIQGFSLNNGTDFSYANDCAGFFTAGIWMGLLTSLLFLLIFLYGLHMIMQLNTMDRFDDPKGPSISVPQTD